MKRSTRIRRKLKNGYRTQNVASESLARAPSGESDDELTFELGEVLSVIRDEDHPNFTSFEDIGKAKVRLVSSQFDRKESDLGFVQPFSARIRAYPLKHELVATVLMGGVRYYLGVANWKSNLNQNAAPFYSLNKKPTKDGGGGGYSEAESGIPPDEETEEEAEIEGFEPQEAVSPIRHRPGDVLFEGRFGHSLKFGRTDETFRPYTWLRSGQREDVDDSPFMETYSELLNEEPSSLLLTGRGAKFPLFDEGDVFNAITKDWKDHLFSKTEKEPTYDDGIPQAFLVSDRVVFNARSAEILGFSKLGIHWSTTDSFTVDAKKEIRTFSGKGHRHVTDLDFDVLTSGVIRLNTVSEKEPVARGQETHDRLVSLLQTLMQETHPSPCGPTGPPMQAPQYQQILQLVKQLVRSEKVFVDESGETFKRS